MVAIGWLVCFTICRLPSPFPKDPRTVMHPNRASSSLSDSYCQPIIIYSPFSVRNPLSSSKRQGQRDLDHGSLTRGPSRRWGTRPFLSRSATQQVFGLPPPPDANHTSCAVTSVSHDATSSRTCPTGCPQAIGGYEATAYGLPLYVPVRVRP